VALWKRGKWYWADFSVNGTRYRMPVHTADRREALAREKEAIVQAKQGMCAGGHLASLARLGFDQAVERYLEMRRLDLQNPQHEADLAKPLRSFFRGRRLNQISADDIRAYQAHRIAQGKHPTTVNHEVKMLFRLLKRAKLLRLIRDDVQLLPVKREPRQMLTQAERQRLFETAATRPEWQTAYCAALLTANTTMRPCELKRLLWRDLDPFNRTVVVRRSKTEAGMRVIPVNEEAWSAIAALKQRADALGTYASEHYIFHRQWPKIDPVRPMGGWRSAWRSLRKAAGFPKLRYYDLRHQSITEMLEAGVPEGVIREVAGHVDPAMTRHYSHPRLAARRAAVEVLGTLKTGQLEGGYVTNHVTKVLPEAVEARKVIERNGTPGVIRTPDPLLRRQVLYPAELRAHATWFAAGSLSFPLTL
jgi:integrase